MADGTTNIYLDATFRSSSLDSNDVSVIFKLAEANNIGSFNVPIVFTKENVTVSFKDMVTEYMSSASVSGSRSLSIEYNTGTTAISGMETALIDYYTSTTISASRSVNVYYATGYLPVSGSQNVIVDFIGANVYTDVINIPINYWTYTSVSSTLDTETLYTNFSGNYDYWSNPISSLDGNINLITEYITLVSGSTVLDNIVDVTFAGWVEYAVPLDIYSVSSGINNGFYTEASVIDGGLLKNDLDIKSAVLNIDSFYNDILCGIVNTDYVEFYLSVISGSVGYVDTDVWSTAINIDSVLCDINLFPIKISNFSLDVGGYSSTDSFISVDVTDDVYNVVTSGTYFMVDGDRVPVTFSGITDGYRMYYDPTDDFTSISGSTEITAHAENDNGDSLEQSYYLTYGYYLKFYNKDTNKVDLGFGKEVDVRMEAEDYANCPTTGTDAYYFYTRYFQTSDLSVSIRPLGAVFSYTDDLSSSIYPVSNAYFYGKVFRVKVDAMDFAGNEMPTYEFEFTIEDPTS